MSDQPLLPSPDEPPPVPPPHAPPPHVHPAHDHPHDHQPHGDDPQPPQRDLLPWLCGLGFLVLAAAIIYLWQYPSVPSETAANAQSLQTLEQHLADLDARVSKLEARPTPDVGKITGRLDALEHKLADLAPLGGRIDAVSAKAESASGQNQSAIEAVKQQIDALTGQLTALEGNVGNVQAISTRLTRIAKLQEAAFALESGRPVGDVPGAPAALARYAHAAPPTKSQLALRFHDAQQAALAAPPPEETNPSLVERALDRAQGLLTIRRGNNVVVGNTVAITLDKAQAALDAGDLAGAVAAVETLTGQPAQAMASWLDDAKGVLSARAALDQMAGQA